MSIQSTLRQFHLAIQLTDKTYGSKLRDKRDRIDKRLRETLKGTATFTFFNQGSYAMGTGVRPLDGDYDIDVGIVFNGRDRAEHTPLTVKQWVYDAVSDHTAKVEWREPCITVYYQERGNIKFHVDLAVFVPGRAPAELLLARGKRGAQPPHYKWQRDGRKAFIAAVQERFKGEDLNQFRRVIAYLKRWKDVRFPSHGVAAPSGFALTVAAFHWFRVCAPGGAHDDLAATLALVRSLRSQRGQRRISLRFPFAPGDDVFGRMSDQQMLELHQRLETLEGWLAEAQSKDDIAPLREAFGSEVPG